jgi:class 3 adenylate cyclase
LDLVVMSGEFVPIDAMHEEPRYASCLDRLAGFARVVCFDRRGVGLSDPVPSSCPTTVEQWVEDALAVLDAAGSRTAAVFAATDAGLAALVLAGTHPERVSALVLLHAYARSLWAPDFVFGQRAEAWDSIVDTATDPRPDDASFELLELLAPSACGDPGFRDWWDRAGHRGASPAVARAMWRALVETDVRHTLPAIHVPCLVLHRADNAWTTANHSHYLAERIEGARLVTLPGADDLWWVGDTDALLDEVEEFLTGRRPAPDAHRVLATVMFTDIVSSTERAAVAGDRRWAELLARHNETVRRQFQHWGGREIKTTGDGFLATFDGPARAIRCACDIRDALRFLGIEVRVGLHTGEVEVMGDDVGGIAVHIAARVTDFGHAGDVLVSGAIPPLVAGSGIQFSDRGEHQLKGVPGTWHLFTVHT